jgi:hypothetical protein
MVENIMGMGIGTYVTVGRISLESVPTILLTVRVAVDYNARSNNKHIITT